MPTSEGKRPTVVVAPPRPLAANLFVEETWRRLQGFAHVVVNESDANWTGPELARRLEGADGLITSWGTPALTGAVLERARHLKIVAHAAGSVKNIVTPDLARRGVVVTSASIALAPAVAESTVLFMLAAMRNLVPRVTTMREGGWVRELTREMTGKRVGLVGFGLIAREVARRLLPFDVTLLVYDPYVDPREIAKAQAKQVDLHELLTTSDVISLHVPDVEETQGMVGAAEFAKMKSGVILVNTSRGRVIDEDALVEAARSGKVRACLDVYRKEPLASDHPLRELAALLTPHVGGYTVESRLRCGALAVQQLEAFFVRNERPPLAVDLEQLSHRA